jgi:hypothetical protein
MMVCSGVSAGAGNRLDTRVRGAGVEACRRASRERLARADADAEAAAHAMAVSVFRMFAVARTPSTMLELGTPAPASRYRTPTGQSYRWRRLAAAPALLVMFICNHCPFVKHVRSELALLGRDYTRGVGHRRHQLERPEQYPDDAPPR